MNKTIRNAALAGALAFAALGSAQANVTYTYSGNNFGVFVNDFFPVGQYTNAMSVSGSFELASALPAFAPLTAIAPLSFSFTDGRSVFTDLDFGGFVVSTDATGNIDHWAISITFSPNARVTNMFSTMNVGFIRFDQASKSTNLSIAGDSAAVFGRPGTWTNDAPVSAVPEPEIYAMMGVGLGLLGFTGRRRKRRASV